MSLTFGLADSGHVMTPTQLLRQEPPPPPVAENPFVGNNELSANVQGTKPDALDPLFAKMANGAYEPDSPQYAQDLEDAGWRPLSTSSDGTGLVDTFGNEFPIDPSLLNDDSSGFHAEIYQHEEGGYVVAFRGSEVGLETSELMDWANNLGQGVGRDVTQYSQAIQLAKVAEQVLGDGNVVMTGHSLGGGLASAAALATNASGVTFNASGLSNETLERLGFNPNQVRDEVSESGQVRSYAISTDPLTVIQESVHLPEAVGHALRIAPPPGTATFGGHGGGGPDAVYVEAFNHASPIDPENLPTIGDVGGALVNGGIDLLGDSLAGTIDAAGDVLRNSGNPLDQLAGTLLNKTSDAVDGATDLLGDVTGQITATSVDILDASRRAGGEAVINTVGTVGREAFELYLDAKDSVLDVKDGLADARADFKDGQVISGVGGVVADAADAVVDTVGDLADGVIRVAGDTVQNVTDAGGSVIRDLGKIAGAEGVANTVAGWVEGAGATVSDVTDNIGHGVSVAVDKVGDAAEVVVDKVVDVAQDVANKAVDVAKDVGHKAADVAKDVGHKTVEVAKDVGRGVGNFFSSLNPFK